MPVSPPEYEHFLRPGKRVTVGIDLPEKKFAEDVATVVAGDGGEILLRLGGSGFPSHLSLVNGTKVIIVTGEGKVLFRCSALLREATNTTALRVALPARVVMEERRDQRRVDLLLPVAYYLPASQELGTLLEEMEQLRRSGGDGPPARAKLLENGQSRVNLSGSGLRFKIRQCLGYGTMLHLVIGLPDGAAAPIHAIGTIVRTRELLPVMNRAEYYSTSLAFRVIDNSDRLRLIKYILDSQHRESVPPPES